MEFAGGRHNEGLIGLTEDGIIDPEVERSLEFVPCETECGDVISKFASAPVDLCLVSILPMAG